MTPQEKIRNIAIIAHVDHGKTTLVDSILKHSNIFHENQDEMNQEQILDSGNLERERGITINAKNISIKYKDFKINIIDTPGHADFGGEVERTLNMANGCILVIDAGEGPMPQTKFVLKKALEMKLSVIVLINKIDKKIKDIPALLKRLEDLMLELASDSNQLDYEIFYAIARESKFFKNAPIDVPIEELETFGIEVLLEEIVNKIPAPSGNLDEPFQMQISSLDSNYYQGRYLMGRINRGKVTLGDDLILIKNDNTRHNGKVKKLFVKEGLGYLEVNNAGVGEIIAIAGIENGTIGETLCSRDKIEPLPQIKISSPSVAIKFEANTSPLVGKEGKFVTVKMLEQRLMQEKYQNITLDIKEADDYGFLVAGRGELQLSILIETLRREGYEFQVRKPEVVFQYEGEVKLEPLEELFIESTEEYIGTITTILNERNAEIIDISSENGHSRFSYKILTRNLIGLRNVLITSTKGNVVMSNFVIDYVPYSQQKELFRNGVLIASEGGKSTGYALNMVQERGDLFVDPGVEIYEGMIVGINKYQNDLTVNVCKERHKSAVRMNHSEITLTRLKPIIPMTLDFALSFISSDELLEVTPMNLRLRKILLYNDDRIKANRKDKVKE